jgi:hypothetical protein
VAGAGESEAVTYYDVVKNWSRKIKPHLSDPKVVEVLVRDFHKFTLGRWDKPFLAGMKPTDFESCDWRCERRGRQPQFWDYCKHAACHWIANHCLRLAERAEPKIPWRIVSSQAHSTVWDGGDVLFDFNFLALEVDPDEAWQTARTKGRVLPMGMELVCHMAEHWQAEMRREGRITADRSSASTGATTATGGASSERTIAAAPTCHWSLASSPWAFRSDR